MQTSLRMETTILPGHRLELSNPAFPDGTIVVVIVMLPEHPKPSRVSMFDFLESLPSSPIPRCFETWQDYERHLQEEKNAWER